jgi:hypothetical protein
MTGQGTPGFAVDVIGFDDAIRKLEALARHGPDIVADELHEEFEQILAYSRDELCPIDSGTLRATAYLSPVKVRGDGNIQFFMSYGTNINGTKPAPYAVYVHEDIEKYHEPPTQAKFLEDAVQESIPGLTKRVGVRVRHRMRDL